jgi:hypothetical protein
VRIYTLAVNYVHAQLSVQATFANSSTNLTLLASWAQVGFTSPLTTGQWAAWINLALTPATGISPNVLRFENEQDGNSVVEVTRLSQSVSGFALRCASTSGPVNVTAPFAFDPIVAGRLSYNVTVDSQYDTCDVSVSFSGGSVVIRGAGSDTPVTPAAFTTRGYPVAAGGWMALAVLSSADGNYTLNITRGPILSCAVQPPANLTAGDCPSILPPGALCTLGPLTGFTVVTGSLTIQCVNGVRSAYPTVALFPAPLLVWLTAPSSWQPGSGVPLELSISVSGGVSPLWLLCTWRLQLQQSGGSGGTGVTTPPLVFSSSSATRVVVDPSLLQVDASYVFSVTAADTQPEHRSAVAGAPQSTAALSLRVLPALVAQVSTAAPDPCASANALQCLNGGQCVARSTGASLTDPSLRSYELSCQCPTTPAVFFGSTCAFAVLDCSGCTSLYKGGQSVSLYGVGLHSVYRMRVAGWPVRFVHEANFNWTAADAVIQAKWSLLYGNLQRITFVSPQLAFSNSTNSSSTSVFLQSNEAEPRQDGVARRRLMQSATDAADDAYYTPVIAPSTTNPPSAYKPITLSSALDSGRGGLLEVNYSSLLFYSSSSCGVGVWKEDGAGDCLPCPIGGRCPGGGRVWPLAGWWSWSEYQAPVRCAIAEACPGVDPTANNAAAGGEGGGAGTQVCATAYAGPRCAQCADSYYQTNGHCLYCGSSVDQTAAISLTVSVGAAAMSILALLVALLKALPLAEVMQIFAILQSVALVGVEGARDLPVFSQEASVVFTYINFSQSKQKTRSRLTRGQQRFSAICVHAAHYSALAFSSVSVVFFSQFRY